MTKEIFNGFLDDPNVKWKVDTHRAAKFGEDWQKWLNDENYLRWVDKIIHYGGRGTLRKAFQNADDHGKVLLWADALKRELPFPIFPCTFDMRAAKEGGEVAMYRNQKFCNLNGLCVLDIDHLTDVTQTLREINAKNNVLTISELCVMLGILFAYNTPSGYGLKFVFKARPEWGNLIDNQAEMADLLGVKLDANCKDGSRGAFMTAREDVLYLNLDELLNYDNEEFRSKYNQDYRNGNSQPTRNHPNMAAVHPDAAGTVSGNDNGQSASHSKQNELQTAVQNVECDVVHDVSPSETGLAWYGVPIQKLIDARFAGTTICRDNNNRHASALLLAYDLMVLFDRDEEKTSQVISAQPWFKEINEERGETPENNVLIAVKKRLAEKEQKATPYPSKAMQAAIKEVTGYEYRDFIMGRVARDENGDIIPVKGDDVQPHTIDAVLPLQKWGERIEDMMDDFPCIRESCIEMPKGGYAAAMFAAGAMLGTLMTRCTYHFYHRPEEERRLNYGVFIIGDPASGKSFANRLYKILLSPVRIADAVGYAAINAYKEELKTKGANKEKPKAPAVVIRDHPARTSNGVFIKDMCNAVETVDGKEMHLHLFTFDSELDNATSMGKGGQWIDKASMELKAFHNEEDGQAYSNLDSVAGVFTVYWNYVYTGTPLALNKKVTQANFGSGLATRLACIPVPDSGFRMLGRELTPKVNHAADEMLKTWAFRLDDVHGELPVQPLVDLCYDWCAERMALAEIDNSKADEMLIKRVPYYGINISAPFILMRHWEEWKDTGTFTVDEKDKALVMLILDIQYRCQKQYFGRYAEEYFNDMQREVTMKTTKTGKLEQGLKKLPKEFTTDDAAKVFGVDKNTCYSYISRMQKLGYVRKEGKRNNMKYVKIN